MSAPEHDEDWALDSHEAQLLGRARRALGPTQLERERVLAQLLPALGGAAPVSPASQEPGLAASASAQGMRYFWGVLALGVAGMAGYGWGFYAGSRAPVASAVAGPVTTAWLSGPSPEPPTASSGSRVEPEQAPASEPVPEPVATAAQRASAAALAAIPSAEPAGLDEEVRQLRRIERAIRDGNPRLALVIGEDLDRAIPRGQLLLERRAASAMAGCQLDAYGARARAQRFIDESSTSAYAARVREICKLPEQPQRNGPAEGTDSAEKGGAR